jgi:hypothetical protein
VKLYLLFEQGHDGNRIRIFLFLASALACVRRLTDTDEWAKESQPWPWRREPEQGKDENGNIVWRHTHGGQTVELMALRLNLRDWSFKRWFWRRFSYQNLNEKGRGDVTGSILKHGRAWFKPHGFGRSEFALHWSWSLNPSLTRWLVNFSLDFFDGDSEQDLSMNFGLFGCMFYFTLENFIPRKWARKHQWAHNSGFYISEGSARIELFHAGDDCYRCEGWKGWYKHIFIREAIMGRTDYTSEPIETHTTTVTMPEGSYDAIVTINRDMWRHRRWPFRYFPRQRTSAYIEVPQGVPVPGKGENSWDCGEDAIYATGSSSPTVAAAVAQIITSALKTRERYGGKNWRPQERIAV